MLNYLEKTGLNFISGQTLKATDLQKLNETVNNIVDVVNILLKEKVDINIESNDTVTTRAPSDAVAMVGNTRRALGQKIRFKYTDGRYLEYSYIGGTVNDADWNSVSNWVNSINLIDGGTY